jgi:hypothetical protein
MARNSEALNRRDRVSAGWRGGALEPSLLLSGYSDSAPGVACAPRASGRARDCIVAYGDMNNHGQVVVRPLTLLYSSSLARWTLSNSGIFSALLPYKSVSPVIAWSSGTTLWVGFRSTAEAGWPIRTYRFSSSSILSWTAGPVLSDGFVLAPTVSQSTSGSVLFGAYYTYPNWL